ncbi:hypothetical protein BpHYR1_022726 [Brachionus plicatilis]|uniref:Uncharacterized protein n=1 Tax=Brachionus plicatilis TaxID=10195 RepID=A0A3M7Q1H5_BRAPC|nr:hypothetical protein BpHYR1_022726 [Brachionus plicatilis]
MNPVNSRTDFIVVILISFNLLRNNIKQQKVDIILLIIADNSNKLAPYTTKYVFDTLHVRQ